MPKPKRTKTITEEDYSVLVAALFVVIGLFSKVIHKDSKKQLAFIIFDYLNKFGVSLVEFIALTFSLKLLTEISFTIQYYNYSTLKFEDYKAFFNYLLDSRNATNYCCDSYQHRKEQMPLHAFGISVILEEFNKHEVKPRLYCFELDYNTASVAELLRKAYGYLDRM